LDYPPPPTPPGSPQPTLLCVFSLVANFRELVMLAGGGGGLENN